jgi:hypothetical protein
MAYSGKTGILGKKVSNILWKDSDFATIPFLAKELAPNL